MISALGTIEIYKPTYYTREVNGVTQIVRSRYQNTDDGTYSFPVTDACERSATVMADDYVKLSFKLLHRVVFDAFAYIWYDEQLYFLKEDYRPTSKGSHYEYTMKFVSVANMLDKSLCMRYINVPGQTIDPEPEINMNGTLDDMAAIVMGAINGAAVRLAATRPVGALPLFYVYILQNLTLGTDTKQNTPLKTFSFSGQNISDVLTTLANDYEIEWWVSHESIYASTLHLCRCEVGDTIPVSDEYKSTDESRGLKQPAEYSQEWSNVPQVLIPFGSDRNMNRKQALEDVNGNSMYVSYGKQLRLAPNTTYNVKDREGVSHTVRTNALGAFVSAAVKSGIETTKQFDDIYPRCHFRVMHVQKEGTEHPIYTITAAALKADGTAMSYAEMVAAELLPLQIEPNETLSVVFESGYLNGREFEVRHDIKEVNNVMVWTLTIVPEEGGDDGVSLPFGNFIPHGSDEPDFDGDTFAIFHMVMPAGYVTQAQAELAQAAYDEMLAIEDTRPEIKCKTEQNYFANRRIRLGQRVAVYSELFGELTYDSSDFGISSQSAGLFVSRVTSFQHSLTKPRDIEFKLASACVEGRMASIEAVIADRTSDIRGLEQRSLNLSRRGWHDAAEMEKMLQTVVAQMMLVGTAKNQFSFTMAIESVGNNVVSNVEHFGRLHVSAGYIQHTQEPYIKYSNGGKWEVDAADITTDINNNSILYDPAHPEASETPYYLYAHCVNNATKAQLYLTAEGKESEAGDNGDYLLLGILSSEFLDEEATPKTSLRVFNRSNGFTQIAGGTITTEQIQDPTRSLIIDFQSNPPRIIAKRGAQIIGNITFISSDGSEKPLGSTIDTMNEEINKEIGGDNLLYVNEYNNSNLYCEEGEVYVFDEEITYYSGSGSSKQHTLLPAGKYVFAADGVNYEPEDYHADVQLYIAAFQSNGTTHKIVAIPKGTVRSLLIETTVSCYFCIRAVCDGADMLQSCQAFGVAHNMLLQKGEKSTTFNNYVEHLTSAIKGTTEINGGLVMMNVLMLKNEQGAVTAGMSGLAGTAQNPENVLMWGGGNYEQALNAALHDYYLSGNSGQLITTLLKKDGTGKIGCFRVVDKDTVKVVSGEKTIIITNKGIDDVATVHESHTGFLYGGYSVNGGYGQNDIVRKDDYDIAKLSFTVQKGTFNIKIPMMQIEAGCSATSYPSSSAYEGQHDDGWGEGWWSYNLRVEIRNNGRIIYSTSYKSDEGGVETDNGTGVPVHGPGTNLYFDAIDQNFDLEAGSLEIVIFGDITVGIDTQDDTSVHAGSHADASVNCGNVYVNVTNIDKFVVVAKDGFAVIANSNASFYIRNTETDLTLLAKGLPTSNPNVKGQLYAKSDDHILRVSAG